MKRATIIVSAAIHAGVAMSLMGAAQHGEKRKAIQVAVADAKKTQDLEENVQSIGSLVLAQMKSHQDGFHTRFPNHRADKRVEA